MRLRHPSISAAASPITIRFDGREIAALPGETVAAALSAAEIVAFRKTQSGAPRGLYCGMGACLDCVVTIDGRIGQRACMTKVAPGMEITGAWPAELAPLGAMPAGKSLERVCDVLVVGGGPGGLAAAVAAAEAGASVVLVNVTVVSCEEPGENVWSPGGVAVADAGARASACTAYLATATLACTSWSVASVGKVPAAVIAPS